jgi:hypothetical protein
MVEDNLSTTFHQMPGVSIQDAFATPFRISNLVQ